MTKLKKKIICYVVLCNLLIVGLSACQSNGNGNHGNSLVENTTTSKSDDGSDTIEKKLLVREL